MSLDVYLTGPVQEVKCPTCIYCEHEHSRMEPVEYFDANITHNLGKMAEAAGIYMHLWRPEEIGITKASQLIEPLREGLAKLRADREHFETFNASNGWGLYENFVPWVARYLKACEKWPDADVRASR